MPDHSQFNIDRTIRAAGRSPSATRRSTYLFPQRSSNWER